MPVVFAPLLAAAGTLLAAFHLWLLGKQAWTGQLESEASLRWLLAFGLAGGLLLLHRRRVSLRGRRATALWVLAAVLHGPALADAAQPGSQLLAETSAAAIQIAGAAVGLALAIGLSRIGRTRLPSVDASVLPARANQLAGALQLVLIGGFLPRPPPVA